MKRIALLYILCFPLLLLAQNEYRFTGIYLGNTNTGLRTIKLDIEVLQDKWKWVHKATVTTGSNLEMATVESDTSYAARKWNDIMADPALKNYYTRFMDTYLQRIAATDQSFNAPQNSTGNTITLDTKNQVITVQVRGVEGDNSVMIDICSLDNQYYIMYNKPLTPFSANLIDLSTVRLKPADYIVKVIPNKGPAFSAKISIM